LSRHILTHKNVGLMGPVEVAKPPNRLDNKKVICVSAGSETHFGILAPFVS
jgi:hypothetical protein